MKGLISNIQRFSTQDGPGIRTTVFLKGCPLRCPWCHNMETWTQRPSLLYYDKDCARCGLCARECPAGALELRGEWLTPAELLPRLLRDRKFYAQSGGGVTFSGGEALLQFGFIKERIALSKQQNLHVCLDTSGWGGRAHELAADVDLYLWDVKHTDPVAHESLTGVPLAPILHSLHRVHASGGRIRLRCPIIPGINDTVAHLTADRKSELLAILRSRTQSSAA